MRKWAADPERFYRDGIIPHPTKPRPKCTPVSDRLKEVLGRLNDLLQRLQIDPAFHGGRRGRSALTNAKPHVRKPAVMTQDIQDFFPSVTRDMVVDAFIRQAGCTPEVANLLGAICTPKNQLPQGSSHSPMVSALVLNPVVRRLRRLAESHGGDGTQFVDDTAISGPAYLERLEPVAQRIIEEAGFKVHPEKGGTVHHDQEQMITGYGVNDGVNLGREEMKVLRRTIDNMRYCRPSEREVCSVEGRIARLRQVNPGSAKQYRRKLLRILREHGMERQ